MFDVGYSDLFMKNLAAFGIDLKKIKNIVISHGHDDHTKGLKYYFEKNYENKISILAHPDAFKEKMVGDLKICSPILENELKEKCNLILSKEPVKLSNNIIFLGEIPKDVGFEKRKTIGKHKIDKNWVDDYVMDDKALVYKSEKGIYII